MEGLPQKEDLTKASDEELVAAKALAIQQADPATLKAIAIEARSRDGYDDTDPRYAHLADDCDRAAEEIYTEMVHPAFRPGPESMYYGLEF